MMTWGPIAFDFYSFGSLVGVIFTFFNAQLFFNIKDKSISTKFLGLATLGLGIFHFAYMVSFSLMGPSAAYLRWLVMPAAQFGATYLTGFFLAFPEAYHPKFRKYLLTILYAGVFITTVYFIMISLSAGRVFYFSGHYWDFPIPAFYKNYGAFLLLYFLIFILSGIFQIYKMNRDTRLASAGILFSFALITVVPGILNIQSRDGAFDRGLYQTITDLVLVIGLFICTVFFINNTKDKTTILSRIIGITLATFLLVIQLIAYFSIHQTESSFDRIYYEQARSTVISSEAEGDVSFYFVYDLQKRAGNPIKAVEQNTFSPEGYIEEFWNVWLFSNLEKLETNQPLESTLEGLFQSLTEDQQGYIAEIKWAFKEKKLNSGKEIISYLDGLKRKILYTRNKWRELAPNEVRTKGLALFQIKDKPMSGFHDAARKLFTSTLTDDKLFIKIDKLLAPMPQRGERNYRGVVRYKESNPKAFFYISYFIVDQKSNQVMEVGFPYRMYREYQHEVSIPWMLGGLGIAILVIFGFRLFFLRALIRPIEDIIHGLTEVNSGNLDYRLKIYVEDDIGFMARSFNRMVRSIAAARKRLQQYASQLEQKVQERTKELENTLQQVQALKDQQDGDYFLTSLLLQPFATNHTMDDRVQIDFLLEQKKKFTFRQYSKEIGGDLNIANQIKLNERTYSVFLNADAMGKSMQGAGGALVLGSVFESIITRTQLSPDARKTYPERWIKNTFIELHKVFEGFDGSMLVSLVLGLVDNETGLMYFINAEHPWMVLYRDGIASFIEDELMFRKLGTSGVAGEIYIRTFQLEQGDVVIAGSDGRDDLLISHTEDGKRIINEDERLFLRIVERGQGDLEKIYEELHSVGSLTDDLSLLRVAFVEERDKVKLEGEKLKDIKSLLSKAKSATESSDLQEAISYLEEANSLDKNIPEIKKKFIQLYLKIKDYGKAKVMARDYSELKPMDTEIMYVTAFCARKVADLKTAIDFGERVRLRDPNHIKNLINLGHAYIASKNFERALNIMNSAIAIDPENQSLLKLREHILNKQIKLEASP